MTRSHADLMARLDDAVLDPKASLADVLRICMMLGTRIGATSLEQWAAAELEGYSSFDVPDYRRIRAPILQTVADPFGRLTTHLLNPCTLPEPLREHISEIVPLNQGVDALEALASEHEAQQQRVRLSPPVFDLYVATCGRSDQFGSSIVALYVEFPPSLIRGVLGQILTALTRFVAGLGAEVEAADDDQPSAAQADDVLRAIVGSAVIGNLNVITGTIQPGGIVTAQPSEYNFGDIKGNLAAGSSNFSQAYNEAFDLAKVREFADLIAEVAGTLELDADQRVELETGASELHAAIDDPAADKERMRRAVDAVMSPLKLAGQTALRNAAITLGNQAGAELDTAIHHLHP